MTREEFEIQYCVRSNIELSYYKRYFVTLPCRCDYEGCEGWAKISNDAASIENHLMFHAL